jgi:hypothetical protein
MKVNTAVANAGSIDLAREAAKNAARRSGLHAGA